MSLQRHALLSQIYNDRLSSADSFGTAGLLCAALASFFLLVLISGTLLDVSIPDKNRFLLVWTIAFGVAFAALFLTAAGASQGRIPLRIVTERPIQFGILVSLLVLIAASMVGSYFLVHGRKASLIAIGCPGGFQPFQARNIGFAFCRPTEGWSLNVSEFGAEGPAILVRSEKDPQVKVHFHVAAVPDGFVGDPRSYIESVVSIWRKLDQNVTLNSVYFAGKEAFYFEIKFNDVRGRSRRTQALHILMSKRKILFVNSSYFDDTPQAVRDVLIRVASTITFAR
ncbi:MAG: hypothetical protein ACR2OX_00615 [Methyloligellaceae bacterium]